MSVAIDAHLRLLECWGPGPSLSEPSSQTAQTAHILDGSLSGGGLFDMDDIDWTPVQRQRNADDPPPPGREGNVSEGNPDCGAGPR